MVPASLATAIELTKGYQNVATQLVDAYRDAHIVGHLNEPDDKTTQKPAIEVLAAALTAGFAAPRRLSVPPLRGARYQERTVDVLSIEFNGDNATRLCIAWPGETPKWVDASAVSFSGKGAK